MTYLAFPYAIQFSDTMAYGTHHFLTNFKFQCFARESLLFGERFKSDSFKEDFEQRLLLTTEGYTKNFAPAHLGSKVIIFLSFEDQSQSAIRMCFRVLREDGEPVCAGYQMIVCASKETGSVGLFGPAFESRLKGMESLREQKPQHYESFKELLHSSKSCAHEAFPEVLRQEAKSLAQLSEWPLSGKVVSLESKQVTNSSSEIPGQHKNSTSSSVKINSHVNEDLSSAIAIITYGSVLPGSKNSDLFWDQLRSGKSGIVDLSKMDKDLKRDFYSDTPQRDKMYSGLVGWISPNDLQDGDEKQRSSQNNQTKSQKLLQLALRQCFEKFTTTPSALRTECFLGATSDGSQELDLAHVLETISDTAAQIPERSKVQSVIDHLKFQSLGNEKVTSQDYNIYKTLSQTVEQEIGSGCRTRILDAACASSLYAIEFGIQTLLNRAADLIYAGGVFSPGPGNNCLFSQFQGLSKNGSRPFDTKADGVVFGEGAAVIGLMRLEDALSKGLKIYAVLRGVGLSSDGKSPSASVPRREGQVLALERAYATSHIDPSTIQYIETHGTATPKGDATEILSLKDFFRKQDLNCPIVLGSIKALVGHTGWAAGAASVIKICKSLEYGILPRQFQIDEVIPEAAQSQDLFRFNKEELLWKQNANELPRRAGVSGFGFGGTNAHLIVEEYLPDFHNPKTKIPFRRGQESLVLLNLESSGRMKENRDSGEPKKKLELPPSIRVLPDLLEDLDETQILATTSVSEILEPLLCANPELRKSTALIVGLNGKTRRGVEAAVDVSWDWFARRFSEEVENLKLGTEWVTSSLSDLKKVHSHQSRRIGPYTLQAMMPNVTAGRVANLLNLQGPNFTVDSGDQTANDCFHFARMLLKSGSEIVVIGQVPSHCKNSELPMSPSECEFFVMSTSMTAQKYNLAVRTRLDVNQNQNQRIDFFSPTLVFDGEYQASITFADLTGARILVLADKSIFHEKTLELFNQSHIRHLVLNPESIQLNNKINAIVEDEVLAFNPTHVLTLVDFNALDLELDLEKSLCESRQLLDLTFLIYKMLYGSVAENDIRMGILCLNAFDGSIIHPGSGYFSGFLKSVAREIENSRIALINQDSANIDLGILRLWNHLESQNGNPLEGEIFYFGQKRFLRKLVRAQSKKEFSQKPQILDSESVVLITGGARGVTKVLAEALLEKFGCQVILVGRSSLTDIPFGLKGKQTAELDDYEAELFKQNAKSPNPKKLKELKIEIERLRAKLEASTNFETLKKKFGRVSYYSVDVTQKSETEKLMTEVVRTHSKIDFIIHGAGIQTSKKLPKRSLEEFRATLDTKVIGLLNLRNQSRKQFNLDIPFHVLTSAFSFIGNDGQPDYGAANETLDRICHFESRKSGHVGHWTSLGWLAWDSVGMTRGSEFKVMGEKRQLRPVTEKEGKKLFLDFLSSQKMCSTHHLISKAERDFYRIPIHFSEFTVPLKFENRPYLLDHKVGGSPTLPGAYTIDLALTGIQESGFDVSAFEIRDIEFLRFVKLNSGMANTLRARVRLEKSPAFTENSSQNLEIVVLGDFVGKSSNQTLQRDLELCRFTASNGEGRSLELPHRKIHSHGETTRVRDPYVEQDSPVKLEGIFDCLEEIEINSRSRTAKIRGREVLKKYGGIQFPAILVDAASRLAAMYCESKIHGASYVPLSVKHIRFRLDWIQQSLAMEASFHIKSISPVRENQSVRCDYVEIQDFLGRVVIVLEGIRGHILASPTRSIENGAVNV